MEPKQLYGDEHEMSLNEAIYMQACEDGAPESDLEESEDEEEE